MNIFLRLYLISAKVLGLIPKSINLLNQSFTKVKVAMEYVNNEEFRAFYNANENGFINKKDVHTTQQLKWLQLYEKAKNGKADKLITSKIRKSKYLDSLLKKEIDIKSIGKITLKKEGKILEEITIGYNEKKNTMEVATQNNEGYKVWRTLKDSSIKEVLSNQLRGENGLKGVVFNAEMFDMDENKIPKKNQLFFADKFDSIVAKAFNSNPQFQKNIPNIPDDFDENKENYIGQVFNIPTGKMNIETTNEVSFVQMEYRGTDVGNHNFRPLFGMKNKNKNIFINETRFNKINNDQYINVVSKFDKQMFFGLNTKKGTIHFGIKGKNNTVTWQPAKQFFSDESFSIQRRSAARLKLVKNDYILENNAVKLDSKYSNLQIKHHVNGKLMFMEKEKKSKGGKKKYATLKQQDAILFLEKYKYSPNINSIKQKLYEISKIMVKSATKKEKIITVKKSISKPLKR